MPDLRRLFHRIFPALPIALALGTPAFAQKIGTPNAPLVSMPGFFGPAPNWRGYTGPGTAWSYYGVGGGPTIGYSVWGNTAARGAFWSNGLSLYGPSTPTYAPVPGTFGGSDAHRFQMEPPIFGFGLYTFGYRAASPRLREPSVSVYASPAVLPAPSSPSCARLEVNLPCENCEVWINGKKTNANGIARSFESPDLADGKEHRYELIARWETNGETKAESRSVLVAPGKSYAVDFTKEK